MRIKTIAKADDDITPLIAHTAIAAIMESG